MTGENIVSLLAGAIVLCAVAFLFGAPPVHAGECRQIKVSWYGGEHHGRKTASGAVFNQNALTAAMMGKRHFGERWRVTYGKKSVTVTITDTGDFAKYGRGMDLRAIMHLTNPQTRQTYWRVSASIGAKNGRRKSCNSCAG